MKADRRAAPRAQRGFTLVELLTTLTVAAILLAVAAPGFRQLLSAQRLRSASFELISDMVLARSEAIKRGAPVRITPASGGWAEGWVVQAVGGAEPLASRGKLGGVAVTTAPDNITFDLHGRVADAIATVRIGLAGAGARKRCISLDPSGRPRSTTEACPS